MNLSSVVESILFVSGEPVSVEKLVKMTKRSREDVGEAIATLGERCKGGGLVILEKDGKYQLGSSPENAPIIADLVKDEFSAELSRAAVETLAIVAYKGPLTRAEIDYVRGVNSSFILRSLLLRGLVERVDNPRDARSFLYHISFDLLKYLGITKIEDLPRFAEFKNAAVNIPTPIEVRGPSEHGEKPN